MSKTALLTVEEAGRRLDVSVSTVWRRIRCGALPSVRKHGRRLVPATAVVKRTRTYEIGDLPPFTKDNPIFRLIGAGRGGGRGPGARNKHDIDIFHR